MAIRVLGYRSVVEAKGTWPTNYIAKAQELKVLEDVDYRSYKGGATRGNVALVVWNMLRTNMWDVDSENETNGLNYKKTGTMIDKYFEDYTYATVTFEEFEINEEGKVIVALNDSDADTKLKVANNEYEYIGNDFYTFVKGAEVEVLVNEKDETLLIMVPTGADKIVDGLKANIDDEYDSIAKDKYDYVYAIIERRDAKEATELKVESMYIYDIESSKNGSNITLNENNGSITSLSRSKIGDVEDWDDENLLIIDGERASIKDLKVGTTVSRVTVLDAKGKEVKNTTFYIATKASEEGKFTKLDDVKMVATVGGKNYTVDANATYVIDPKDDDEKQTKKLFEGADKDMNKEEVTMYLDAFGRIARLDFDGHIGDDDSSTYGFYVVKSDVERESSKVYFIELENENGDEKVRFASKAKDKAQKFYNDAEGYILDDGDFVMVEFNDDNEIVNIKRLAGYNGKVVFSGDHSGDGEEDTFIANVVSSGEYDDDKEEITGKSGDTAEKDNEDVVSNVKAIIADEFALSNFTEDDRLLDDDTNSVLYIVDGYKAPGESTGSDDPADEPTDEPTTGWDRDCIEAEHVDEMKSTVTVKYVNGEKTVTVDNETGDPDNICDICGAKFTPAPTETI